MGHLSNHGFSSRLLSTIADCRTKVEEWVDREKQAADDMEKTYLDNLSQEQSAIDKLEGDLLSLQMKLGKNVTDKRNSGSPHASVVKQQENLLEEKEHLESSILKLKSERDTKDEIVKRKCISLSSQTNISVDRAMLTSFL